MWWIEDGTFAGKQIRAGRNYYVFESSLQRFIHQITSETLQRAA